MDRTWDLQVNSLALYLLSYKSYLPLSIYFSPDPGWTKKQIRDLVETVKSFVGNLYMNRKKKPGIEETQVSDDEPPQTARPEEGQNSLDKISSFK